MVQKWDAMSTSVPQVVQRLVAVKELHEQGKAEPVKMLHIVTKLLKKGNWARARCWSKVVLAKQLGQSIFRTAALVQCCAVQKRSQASRQLVGAEAVCCIKQCSATLTCITYLSIVADHDTSNTHESSRRGCM